MTDSKSFSSYQAPFMLKPRSYKSIWCSFTAVIDKLERLLPSATSILV